jgi:hypothetical protein
LVGPNARGLAWFTDQKALPIAAKFASPLAACRNHDNPSHKLNKRLKYKGYFSKLFTIRCGFF